MKQKGIKICMLVVGWTFILLGILGLVLPFLQGLLFIAIGLLVLSGYSTWAHNQMQKVWGRFPQVGRAAEHSKARAKEIGDKIKRQFR